MTVIHHEEIRRRVKLSYSADEISDLIGFLQAQGTLSFTPLPTGLYPAAGIDPVAAAQSGYGNVWVRDNIYVALAHGAAGQQGVALSIVKALAAFFSKYRSRFEAIVEGRADPNLPMNRPHVRFDGLHLAEIPARWAHAQNDALGYFLWSYCRMAYNGYLEPDGELLALFVLYFQRIRYWEDEDNGHWEEARKVGASSIGAVVAGLCALRKFLARSMTGAGKFGIREVEPDFLDELVAIGQQRLATILPAECVQHDPKKSRRYDAALLFLVFPLEVVDDAMGQRIVDDVIGHLQGDHGIRRYLGDSYWTADYKDKLPPEALAADVSECQEMRDALARPGEEAEWCIFDPVISVIAGRRYLQTGDRTDLERQVLYLNRSLGQITGPGCLHGELRCPEAYYLKHGQYVPNDHVPLLWTQANLWLALGAMQRSLGLNEPH
jgi:hypothetical protein